MEKAPHYHPPSSHLMEPMSPRLRPFPSIFRPKASQSLHAPCFDSLCDDLNGRSCLLASRSCENEFDSAEKVKESARKKKDTKRRRKTTTTKKKKKDTQMKINHKETIPFGYSKKEADDFGGNWWYSSDDEDDETDTLFSSKSTSSDSSQSRRFRRRHRSRRRKQDGSRFSSKKGNSEMGVLPLQVKVKDSFAVVKRSSDPYNDFRTSMVEMIVEKQIFAAKDLENLLQCFLSLNSHHHHKIIVEVFTEIYDALFCDWV
ncbi:transcription repressor OFP8-like [Neltuma alba]|uniref:transcription repressor OFP8-like n=1 Tax=Neltuma alba TaxID=207710 RepID=UPI0010A48051|nr:transcription repressor OFP8-like [Prosopis alba]